MKTKQTTEEIADEIRLERIQRLGGESGSIRAATFPRHRRPKTAIIAEAAKRKARENLG